VKRKVAGPGSGPAYSWPMTIRLKRVYDPASPTDGLRILVDRLWPRGMKKEDAALDRWERDVAPSNELRKEFGHHHSRWDEFKARYFAELEASPEPLERLAGEARKGTVTLLFAARDTEKNNAVALAEYLRKRVR
jgi:uncharacterized protein YeaO (DUF488 family)